MAHNLTPSDLQDNSRFRLLEKVEYSNLKQFVIAAIQKQSKWLKFYGYVQLMAILLAVGVLAFLITAYILGSLDVELLKCYLAGIFFSFTLIIPIHEFFHALAFWALGKRDIGFGMQLKKFIFYAEANHEVLDRKEITIVAFAPLLIVGFFSVLGAILSVGNPEFFMFLSIFLIHFLFCAGDMAIVAFFHSRKNIFSYDDREKKMSYYFVKIEDEEA
jgi:hypothetical protein